MLQTYWRNNASLKQDLLRWWAANGVEPVPVEHRVFPLRLYGDGAEVFSAVVCSFRSKCGCLFQAISIVISTPWFALALGAATVCVRE